MNRQVMLLLGFWLLIALSMSMLVAVYVGIRMDRLHEEVASRFDQLATLETKRTHEVWWTAQVSRSDSQRKLASQMEDVYARQHKLEMELVRMQDIAPLATGAQIDSLTRAMEKRFKLTIQELRYPNAHLPPPR